MLPTGWTAGAQYGYPFSPATSGTAKNWSWVLGSNAAGKLSFFAVELDGINAPACSGLLSYFSSGASTANGGQITGLIGSVLVAAAPNGTAIQTTTPTSGTYAAASGCATTAGTAPNTGTNNVAVWFDMARM